MAGNRVSLKQIAEAAGVSVPTVSQILNNKAANYSSEATRRKVLETARQLNYRPSFAYRLMQGKTTNTAAILASTGQLFQEEYLKNLFIELTSCFERKKWSVYTGVLTMSAEANVEVIHEMNLRGVEMVVLIGTPVGWEDITAKLEEYAIPYVGTVEKDYRRAVQNGSAIGVERIIRKLKETAGRKLKLVCSGSPEDDVETLPRFRSLRAAYPELTATECLAMTVLLPPIPAACADYPSAARKAGYAAAQKILVEEPETRAIVFLNDDYAMGGGYFLMENPAFLDRVRIAGYNNNASLATFPVPITTGGTPPDLWAEEIVDSLLSEGSFDRIVCPVLRFREPASEKKKYPFWNEEIVQVDLQ